MYMSNSTLEKLLDILHNKMITGQETVSGMANVKRARNVSSSSGEDDEEEEEEEEDDDDCEEKRRDRGGRVEREDEEEDDGNVDEEEDNGVTAFREKVPEWMSMIDSGIKLSGPVTDL